MFDPSWATLPLGVVAARLTAIRHPDELFGPLAGASGAAGGVTSGDPDSQLRRLHAIYRQLALCVHPDRHAGDPRATSAFAVVQRLYQQARQEIVGNSGGASGAGVVTIASRRRQYTVGSALAQREIAVLYEATAAPSATVMKAAPLAPAPVTPVILKVVRYAEDNDLLANEASALRTLSLPASAVVAARSPSKPASKRVSNRATKSATNNPAPIPPYVPRLLESFVCRDATGVERAVQAFPLVITEAGTLAPRDFFTLSELRAAYPAGLDPRHIGWIWRRLLIALGHAHQRSVIHGGVLPEHVLIHPADHGLLLVDWCASVQLDRTPGGRIAVISPDYEGWYPPATLAGRTPSPAIDLLMGLRCMVYLLGGDPLSGALPASVPGPLQAYLRGALAAARAGQTDAPRLYQDFTRLLASLWGRRRFVPLAMPIRPGGPTTANAGARP